MDLLKKILITGRKERIVILLLVLASLFAAPLHAYAPVLLLGVYGEQLFTEDQGGQTSVRSAALLSWRGLPGENTSVALYTRSVVDCIFTAGGLLYDAHTLSLNTLISTNTGRLAMEGGFSGSWKGTFEGQSPYFRPDWRIGYEYEAADFLAGISYSGYYLYQPDGSDDSLFQGLTMGLSLDPSIRFYYGFEALGGWEYWPEQNRNDILGSVEAGMGGLAGFFLDWTVAAQTGMRWSQDSTKSNLFMAADTEWAWSPRRQLSFELGAFARGEIFYWDGGMPDVPTVLYTGCDLRGDWTPNDSLFLVAELSASRRFASGPGESGWMLLARAGVEFSF